MKHFGKHRFNTASILLLQAGFRLPSLLPRDRLARAPRNGNVEAAPKADGITTGRNDCAGVPLAWLGAVF